MVTDFDTIYGLYVTAYDLKQSFSFLIKNHSRAL